MNIKYRSRAYGCGARRERGVVLFIALIAMVVMSLAGVAMIRAVDTAGSVAGNLAFREAANAPVNYAIERAVSALFGTTPTVTNRTADLATQGYFASLQAGELANGAPAALGGTYPPSGYAGPVDIDSATKAETRRVIERLCNAAGLPTIKTCDELPPKVSLGKTTMKLKNPTLPPIPLYRITVRVDLPGTNTVSYAQAMIME
jgi:type IV pilus assembly protein PilX